MPRIAFRKNNIRNSTLQLVSLITDIISSYDKLEITLTLRQLYYQLVSRNIIANTDKEYHRLSVLVTKARYNGYIDWDSIEDRTRKPIIPNEFNNLDEFLSYTKYWYELDYWKGQSFRPEIWVEKEALSNICLKAVEGLHVPVCVNKGYCSASTMYNNAMRIKEHLQNCEDVTIFYLGDHDPSGLHMVEDIRNRMTEFLSRISGEDYNFDKYRNFKVIPLALNMDQVNEFSLPENPTKLSDTRAQKYIDEFGYSSWELDALSPEYMIELIKTSIEAEINDIDAWNDMKAKEKHDITKLVDFANNASE
jgi:hypothetical protein